MIITTEEQKEEIRKMLHGFDLKNIPSIEEQMEDVLLKKQEGMFAGDKSPQEDYSDFTNIKPLQFIDTRPKEQQDWEVKELERTLKMYGQLSSIIHLVENTPNDQELGAAIREFYYKELKD